MILYFIDRDAQTADTFDAMKAAALKSLASLGPQVKYKLVFWETENYLDIPAHGILNATPENVALAATELKPVQARSTSRIEGPIEKGITKNPTTIVIATGKGGLDDTFVNAVLDRRAKSKVPQVKIHTFCFGDHGSPEALRKIAERTGGTFRQVKGDELKMLTQP
jgi:hypothetical protein